MKFEQIITEFLEQDDTVLINWLDEIDQLELEQFLKYLANFSEKIQKTIFHGIIKNLEQKKEYKIIYELYNKNNNFDSIDLDLIYANSLWSLGKISYFKEKMSDLVQRVLSQKLYCHAQAVYESLSEKKIMSAQKEIFYLMYLIEVNDLKQLNDLEGLKELSKEKIKQIYHYITGIIAKQDDPPLELERFLLNIKLQLNEAFSLEEVLKFALLYRHDDANLAKLISQKKVSKEQSSILSKYYKELTGKEVKPDRAQSILINTKKIEEVKKEPQIEVEGSTYQFSKKTEEPNISKEEERILLNLDFSEKNPHELEKLFSYFMFSEMYQVCDEICKYFVDSEQRLLNKTLILFYKENYQEIINLSVEFEDLFKKSKTLNELKIECERKTLEGLI